MAHLQFAQVQALQVDQVDVGLQAGAQGAPVVQAEQVGIGLGLLAHHQLDGQALAPAAVAHPVGELVGWPHRIEDQVDVGARVGQADGGVGVGDHLLHDAEGAVHEVGAEQDRELIAIAGGQVVVNGLRHLLPGGGGSGGHVAGGVRLVVDGQLDGEHHRRCHRHQPVNVGHHPRLVRRHVIVGEDRCLHFRLSHFRQARLERQVGQLQIGPAPHEHVIGLQAGDEADGPRGNLRPNGQALGVGPLHDLQAVAPLVGPVAVLDQGEGAGAPTGPGHRRKQLHFLFGGPLLRPGDVAHHASGHRLEDALASGLQGLADGQQFGLLGEGAGDGLAEHRPMANGARGGKAQGTRLEAVLHDAAHGRKVLGGGVLMAQRPLAHHVVAHRTVRHLGAHIQGVGAAGKIVDVLRETLPVAPFNAFVQGGAGDVFHPFHQLHQALLAARRTGCEADAAIAHHNAGDAVAKRGIQGVIPTHLPVVMSVHVDPPRRGVGAVRVDGLLGLPIHCADGGDAPVLNGDVAVVGLLAAAIHNSGVLDKGVVHVPSPTCR